MEQRQREIFRSQIPIFYLSRIMGLAPFSVNHKDKTGFVKVSLPWLIYSIAFYIGYLTAFIICVDISWRIPLERNYPFISVIGHLIQILLGVVIFNVCYIYNFIKAQRMSAIGLGIVEIDSHLMTLTGPNLNLIDQPKMTRLKWILIGHCVSFFIFMIVFDYFVFKDLYGNYMLLMCFTYIMPYFSASVVMLQFMNLVSMLKERFDTINKFIEHIHKTNETHKSSETPLPAKREFLTGKSNKTSEKLSPYLHLRLHDIFRIHDQICVLLEEVNDGYSTQMVTCITAIFVLLIFGLFFETKVVFWAWGGAFKLVLISSSYLIWGVISTMVIYLVLFMCTTTRDAANKSALIVHKILQSKPAFMLNDEAYYNKMKSFTLQVLHRKNILHFNGIGLFRLDYTFIFSAVSAATSYLIVLLQFDLSDELQAFSSSKFY